MNDVEIRLVGREYRVRPVSAWAVRVLRPSSVKPSDLDYTLEMIKKFNLTVDLYGTIRR